MVSEAGGEAWGEARGEARGEAGGEAGGGRCGAPGHSSKLRRLCALRASPVSLTHPPARAIAAFTFPSAQDGHTSTLITKLCMYGTAHYTTPFLPLSGPLPGNLDPGESS